VYITGLVATARGRRCPRPAGNVVDPLDLIDRYGADALRLTLAADGHAGSDLPCPRSAWSDTGVRQQDLERRPFRPS